MSLRVDAIQATTVTLKEHSDICAQQLTAAGQAKINSDMQMAELQRQLGNLNVSLGAMDIDVQNAKETAAEAKKAAGRARQQTKRPHAGGSADTASQRSRSEDGT